MIIVIAICDRGVHCSELFGAEVYECARGVEVVVLVVGKVSDIGVADELFETLISPLVVSWVAVLPSV